MNERLRPFPGDRCVFRSESQSIIVIVPLKPKEACCRERMAGKFNMGLIQCAASLITQCVRLACDFMPHMGGISIRLRSGVLPPGTGCCCCCCCLYGGRETHDSAGARLDTGGAFLHALQLLMTYSNEDI